jgi:phosphate uptake regulator
MDTRKIMALGKSSLVISLPKEWISVNNLKRGDIVNLEIQRDLSLLVNPLLQMEKKEKRKLVVIEPDQEKDEITRIIIGCYLNGYNTIQLTSKKFFTPIQQKAIREIVKSLYIWVMESQASEVVLQILLNESLVDFESGIERMHMITNSMFQDLIISMESWNRDLASSVLSLEDDVDQFKFSLHRFIRSAATNPSLAGSLGVDMLDCLDYQHLVNKIELVADHLSYMAESIVDLKNHQEKVEPEVWNILIEAAKLAYNSYETAVERFLEGSIEDSSKIINNQDVIEQLIWKITPLPRISEKDISTFYHLFTIKDNIKRIGEDSADIAELTIDRHYKPQNNLS